jgi:hypothetical protein
MNLRLRNSRQRIYSYYKLVIRNQNLHPKLPTQKAALLLQAVFGGAIFIGSTEDFPTEGCGIVGSSCGTVSNTAFWWNEAELGGAVYIEDASANCAENGGHKFECTTCSFQDNSAKVSFDPNYNSCPVYEM